MTPPVPPVGHYDAQYGHFASRFLDIACGAGGPTLRIAARAAFDGLICVDAVNHLPHRDRVFREWARVLRPGRRGRPSAACPASGSGADGPPES